MSSSSSPSPPSFKDPGLLSSSSSLANNASIMAVEGGPKILARLPLGQCHWKLVISFNHWHYHINHDWSISTTISIESTTRCSSTLAIMSDASGYLQVTSMSLLDLGTWYLILDPWYLMHAPSGDKTFFTCWCILSWLYTFTKKLNWCAKKVILQIILDLHFGSTTRTWNTF